MSQVEQRYALIAESLLAVADRHTVEAALLELASRFVKLEEDFAESQKIHAADKSVETKYKVEYSNKNSEAWYQSVNAPLTYSFEEATRRAKDAEEESQIGLKYRVTPVFV